MSGFNLNALPLYCAGGGPAGTTKDTTTSIDVTPATKYFNATGSTQALTVKNQAGTTLTTYLTFSSDDTDVVTVSDAGVLTSTATGGTATITVTYSEPDDEALTDTMDVYSSTSIVATPATWGGVTTGDTQQITVVDQDSTLLTALTSYDSDNTGVTSVNSAGLMTMVGAGTATITATYGCLTDTIAISQSISATPSAVTFDHSGLTSQLEVVDQDGNDITTGSGVTYVSDDEAVATVDSDGLITSVAVGTCVITATYGSLTDTCDITVTA